jgi:hypothetical protein
LAKRQFGQENIDWSIFCIHMVQKVDQPDLNTLLGALGVLLSAVPLGPTAAVLIAAFLIGLLAAQRTRRPPT